MKLLRWLLALVVLAYAAWLVWPLAASLLGGQDMAIERAAVEASDKGANLPLGVVWIAAAALYALSAFLLGNGNPRAFVAYLLGFAADAFLKIALDGRSAAAQADVAMRSTAVAESGVDPLWLILGGLAVVGVLVFALSRRRKRRRSLYETA
ncbi:hypothetical protein Q0812_07520 [Brevundimonas sp. 2R-24]|uniref:Uncharacterized protein n=1 Tax=Peiella sedimenti TaxID=3061083 RepID=A0ABT8SL28_9CAUL|nr:hypothetical protein [Caulobacteraceae bacterium XZ-24]